MNGTAKVIFSRAFSGTSKKGNAFNMITFTQLLKPTDDKPPVPREVSFFVEEISEDVKALKFGDVVQIEVEQSENLSDPPRFVRVVEVVRSSPYFDGDTVSL